MISHGNGLLVIQENKVPEFKKLLVEYYEGEDLQSVTDAFACVREDDWKARCENERKRIGGRLRSFVGRNCAFNGNCQLNLLLRNCCFSYNFTMIMMNSSLEWRSFYDFSR
ncbi:MULTISPECIES: hypothetical protein [Gardnerella]|uniref:Uncharacterized protein n=1 Tax=Gardnerella vaginalis TaxID=2702 RepID=A0AAP8IUT3_GARVA|nr:hypothetical protein [Gardnerella sp. 30-4]PKZ60422.1 hypothetical protein CYJ61_03365 [Gardnerella vaginalis]